VFWKLALFPSSGRNSNKDFLPFMDPTKVSHFHWGEKEPVSKALTLEWDKIMASAQLMCQ
jgi:hypothetical protein